MTGNTAAESAALALAPIPAHHPYVEAVLPPALWPELERVVPPEVAQLADGAWRPHPLLEAQAVLEHAGELDAIHLHFGFEHRSPAQIRAFIEACRQARIALILTVHDLQNPHLVDQTQHLQRLSLLVTAAQAVITLTEGAAAEIQRRFGRRAQVIAHPSIVAPEEAARLRRQRGPRTGRRVGVFLKDLRASTVTGPAFYRDLAADLSRELPDAELDVLLDRRAADGELGAALASLDGLTLRRHDRMGDRELHACLEQYDVVVLPYLRGTHSGWLEMCRDLDVVVVAPDCGHYAGQADRPGAVHDYATGDGRSAGRAVRAALGQGPLPCAVDRRAQREQIARAHRAVLLRAAAVRGSEVSAP